MKKILLILWMILLIYFCSSCSDFNPDLDEKILRDICEVSSPKSANKLEERDIIRFSSGVISKFYSHEVGCPTVEKHYKQVLSKNGWNTMPRSYFGDPERVDFRKQKLDISLTCSDIRNSQGKKIFSISCSKGLRPLF